MVTLLLDSSNTSLSVGIASEGKLLDFTSYESWQTQSENMVPEIDKLLKKHDISRNDIKDIVCAIGPGSYTGVRIALTIAKTISLCLDIPIYPVSSLRILKKDDKPSICVINARSERSYFGVYENNKVIVADCIKTNDEVLAYIKEHPDYVLCGDARYLGFDKVDNNVCLQMTLLKDALEKLEDTLGLKPVYMKD